jgi:hypothetical protein
MLRRRTAALLVALFASLAAASPPPSDDYLTSAQHPIRVYYPTADLTLAQAVLSAADSAWSRLIDEIGYATPWTGIEGDELAPGLWIYLDSTGMGADASIVEWVADVPQTPACDCAARVIVDNQTSPDSSMLAETLFHETVHAAQYAVDCTEPPSAYEGMAIAAVAAEFPDSPNLPWTIEEFQSFPEYPLDYWTMIFPGDGTEPNFAYQLGSGLFYIYLVERYGGGNPAFLPDLFSSCGQDGTTTIGAPHPSCSEPNKPDWLENIETRLALEGRDLREAFAGFAVWRAVTGAHDDGAHFSNGADYAEVPVAATVGPNYPAEGTSAAYEWGTRYIEVTPVGGGNILYVGVSGDPAALWTASLLFWTESVPVQELPLYMSGAQGSASFGTPYGTTRILLAVSQFDDGSHDADEMDYDNERTFEYRVDYDNEGPSDDDSGDDQADDDSPGGQISTADDDDSADGCSC